MPQSFPEPYFSTYFSLEDAPEPLPCRFAIVTAFNPMDRKLSHDENRLADQSLKNLIKDRNLSHFRATGGSPDMSHSEPGWAIETNLESALEMARKFNQRALWWIEDDELHLVDCSRTTPLHLSRFSDRLFDP